MDRSHPALKLILKKLNSFWHNVPQGGFLLYNKAMLLPRIMPGQIKNEPDEVTKTLNAMIDIINDLQRNR